MALHICLMNTVIRVWRDFLLFLNKELEIVLNKIGIHVQKTIRTLISQLERGRVNLEWPFYLLKFKLDVPMGIIPQESREYVYFVQFPILRIRHVIIKCPCYIALPRNISKRAILQDLRLLHFFNSYWVKIKLFCQICQDL